MLKYVIKVDDGCDGIRFEFDNGSSAIAFAQVALEHLCKRERSYHDSGVTVSIFEIEEVKPVKEPDDDNENDNEENEEDE